MAKGQGKRIPDEKRAAVIAALLAGQGMNEIAAKYQVSQPTVARLKKLIPVEELNKVVDKKNIDLAAKIGQFLDASFEAMLNVLAVTKDNAWLSKQPASELATFNGVTADKVFRILEAIENAKARSEADQDWPEVVR